MSALTSDDRCALFAPDLAGLDTAAAIGVYLKDWHGRLNSRDAVRERPAADLLAHNTALVDAVLRRLFDLAVERAALTPGPSPKNGRGGEEVAPSGAAAPAGGSGEARSVSPLPFLGEGPGVRAASIPALAIIATGGYGRCELAPFSDVDVTFVPAREDDPYLNAIIKDMFQSVMDVFLYKAGLKVGYAYRLLGDLGQLDHQTQTTLLDARFLCGDPALFKEFRAHFRAQILTADFLFRKWAERLAVLARHGGDQVYGVEPNIKEGAGGLRDVQNAEWIGEVRFHVGRARLWPALIERGVITAQDGVDVAESRAFLLRARNALHVVTGEARDTLTAEKQEAVAALLEYPDTPEVPAVETFMRDYYAHAARARRIARKAITRCLDSELPLAFGLASRERTLVVADPALAAADPALPLHAAELAQAYDLRVTDALDEEVACFLESNPAPADPAYAGRVLTRMLTAGRAVADTLERLEEQGALAWLLPEFGALMTLIPYDAAHDYTVGAHSLLVVRNLENLKTETDSKLLDYRRIVGEVANPEVLYLAGLLHDVGKQSPEAGHAELGATAVAGIAERLGWDRERRDRLVFLVRHHLLMAETSRLRDLALDETIREFVRQVPDLDCLNMLYLLTYADTSAVGAGVWTEVKGKFLSELYYRAEAALSAPPPREGEADATQSGEGAVTAPSVNLPRLRDRIRKGLAQHNLPPDLIHEHTRNLPAQYLLNTPLEEMYLHIAMIGRLRETFQPIVDFRNEFGAEYTEMTLCAYDDARPGLLAKITGVLYAHDINVHVAQVFTREASVRIAIDTLWVDYRGKPLSPGKRTEVQNSLRRVLTGEIGVGALLQKHRKPLKEQTIHSARIDDQASERFSLLEVSAPDEKGVVYRLARTISALGWNIHAARLSVWGSRARDAFYITDIDGRKIPAADVAQLLAALPTETFVRKKRPTGA